jgi:hypothetical protein
MQQFSSLLSWRLFTAQHVLGVLTPIIRSSTTTVAASGFTFVSWWQPCCCLWLGQSAYRPQRRHETVTSDQRNVYDSLTPPRTKLPLPINSRMFGLQSRSGRFGIETNFMFLRKIQPQFPDIADYAMPVWIDRVKSQNASNRTTNSPADDTWL